MLYHKLTPPFFSNFCALISVVKLFNAVSRHQKEMESKLTSAPTEAKKSKGMKISSLARCKGSCFCFYVFFREGGGRGWYWLHREGDRSMLHMFVLLIQARFCHPKLIEACISSFLGLIQFIPFCFCSSLKVQLWIKKSIQSMTVTMTSDIFYFSVCVRLGRGG